MSNIERSEFYGSLQRIVDALFYDLEAEAAEAEAAGAAGATAAQGASGGAPSAAERLGVSPRTASLLGLSAFDAPAPEPAPKPASPTVRRLDVVIAAEAADLPEELMRIVNLLPPGNYTRQRLCDQINSAINGHAWGQVYGTVS